MPVNNVQAVSSRGLSSTRRLNGDGTITIICRVCGNPICRVIYSGFSTSICATCQGLDTSHIPTGAITLPDGRILYQPDQYADAILYPEQPAIEKVGLARAVFRAFGFMKRREPKPPAVRSKSVAREKLRKPLFGPEDEGTE